MYLHQLKAAEQRIDGATKEKSKDHKSCEYDDRSRPPNTVAMPEPSKTTEGLLTNMVRKVVHSESCTFARNLVICKLCITGNKNMIVLPRVKCSSDGWLVR